MREDLLHTMCEQVPCRPHPSMDRSPRRYLLEADRHGEESVCVVAVRVIDCGCIRRRLRSVSATPTGQLDAMIAFDWHQTVILTSQGPVFLRDIVSKRYPWSRYRGAIQPYPGFQ